MPEQMKRSIVAEPISEPLPKKPKSKEIVQAESTTTATEDLSSHTLYIKNLNDKINHTVLKHNLYLLFTTFGDVLQIVLMKNFKMRGQAHVVFSSTESARLALRSLQNDLFFGKNLKIEYARKTSKLIAENEAC